MLISDGKKTKKVCVHVTWYMYDISRSKSYSDRHRLSFSNAEQSDCNPAFLVSYVPDVRVMCVLVSMYFVLLHIICSVLTRHHVTFCDRCSTRDSNYH